MSNSLEKLSSALRGFGGQVSWVNHERREQPMERPCRTVRDWAGTTVPIRPSQETNGRAAPERDCGNPEASLVGGIL